MNKKRTTFDLPEDLLRAIKLRASRSDRRPWEVVEEAVKAYLGSEGLARTWGDASLDELELMAMVVDEVRASRAVHRAARGH